MKQVDEMPTGGQFVAVWQGNSRVQSDEYFFDSSLLRVVCSADFYYESEIKGLIDRHKKHGAVYFIAD